MHSTSLLAVAGAALLSCGSVACTSPSQASPSPAPRVATAAGARPADRAGAADAHVGLAPFAAPPRAPSATGAPFFAPLPALRVTGGLDAAVVERELARHLADLDACYQRRLAVHPGLAGQVFIHWSIGADGAVVEQCITEDTVGDEGVVDCVNAQVKATRYPAPRGGSAGAAYPFTFQPGAAR